MPPSRDPPASGDARGRTRWSRTTRRADERARTTRRGRRGAGRTATVASQHSVAEALEFQRRSSEAMGSALYAAPAGRPRGRPRGRRADDAAPRRAQRAADPRGRRAPPARRRAPPGPRGAGSGAGAVLPVGRRDRRGRSDAGLPRRGRREPAGGRGRDDPRRADQRGRAGGGAGARLRAHRPARAADRCGCWRSGARPGCCCAGTGTATSPEGPSSAIRPARSCSTTSGSIRPRTCPGRSRSPSAAAATWPRSTPSARTAG